MVLPGTPGEWSVRRILPPAQGHESDCESYLPLSRPCTCQEPRYIVVAPSTFTAVEHLRRLTNQNSVGNNILVYNLSTADRLRGLRYGGPYRLEIIGWPESPHGTVQADAEVIRDNLLAAGWPIEEIDETTT